jgi:2'-5' RNA ligase
MRAFVAIDISEQVRKALGSVMREYKRYDFFRVVAPESMHLTLVFMSEISESQAASVAEFIRSLPAENVTGVVEARGFDCFPSMHRPRVAVVQLVEETGKLQKIFENLTDFLRASSIPFDDTKEYKPHLTLARIPNFKPQLRKLLDEMKEEIETGLKPEERTFTDLTPHLYKSILLPNEPPRYEKIV